MARVPIFGITGVFIWELWEKSYFDVALVACHKEYYKREGDSFPKFRPL